MEWEIKIHYDLRYLELITRGTADNDSALRMSRIIADVMRKNALTKALIDHRAIEKFAGNEAELFNRAKVIRMTGLSREMKIAEVVRSEHQEPFKFLETVFMNYGFKFSVFSDRDAALKWIVC